MRVLSGTSGYSYKAWKGTFYPEGLPDREMLHYYAERLPAVEMNSSFYRLPKPSVVRNWADQVPECFSFALKASRLTTHGRDTEKADEALRLLAESALELDDRLGPILLQFPPWLRKSTDRLDRVLSQVKQPLRAAVEFRHTSWQDEEVFDMLRSRDAALVVSDVEGAVEPEVRPAAEFGYLRLRRPDYDDAALDAWAERVMSQPWEEVYVFFKHEDTGAGPRLARQFQARFGPS